MIGTAHHYGVTVSDIDRTLSFYEDVLGLEKTTELSFQSEAFDKFVGVDGADVDIVFLNAGDCDVELLEYNEPEGNNANAGISNNDIGASHLCLEVNDLDSVYDDIADDIEFINPPQTLDNGAIVAYAYDPDGNVIEFLEE